jgi:hypothetical protein
MEKKTLLVLYYTVGASPLRDTAEKHLYSWKRYSKHRAVYINVRLGFPERLLRNLDIDVVVFHTSFLGMRWDPDIFKNFMKKCAYLKGLECIKIAVPQDEFMQTEVLNDFINDFGVTHVLTCAEESDWRVIYDRIDRESVSFRTVLTGYLDSETVERVSNLRNGTPKDIDIGYRAWKAEYWLGEHGMHKVRIAEIFDQAANRRGLKTDISLREEDVLAGDAWFDFLLRSRTTIGAEGGASIIDRRGDIKMATDNYLAEHPGASFEEVRDNCFKNEDQKLGLTCISPRHLEACMTGTCQLLVEGRYNDILRPWRHYIPVKKDYSNIEEALDKIRDGGLIAEITSRAYEDIVASGRWTYNKFVGEIEDAIIDYAMAKGNRSTGIRTSLALLWLDLRDFLSWQVIGLVVKMLSVRSGPSRLIIKALKRMERSLA